MGCAARIIEPDCSIARPSLAEIVAISGRRPAGGRLDRGRNGGIGGAPLVTNPTNVTTATKRSWHRGDLGVIPGTGAAGWVDQFGNGYDVAQATGSKQPTVDTLDGQAALLFSSAAAQLLLLTDLALVTAAIGGDDVAYTQYIVFSSTSLAALCTASAFGASTSAVVYDSSYITTAGVLHHQRRNGGTATDATLSGATVATGTPYLLRIRFSGTDVSYTLNGTVLTPDAPNNVTAIALMDRFCLGAYVGTSTVGSAFLNGRIAESILYTGLVSSAQEAQLVSNYFTPRYPSVS